MSTVETQHLPCPMLVKPMSSVSDDGADEDETDEPLSQDETRSKSPLSSTSSSIAEQVEDADMQQEEKKIKRSLGRGLPSNFAMDDENEESFVQTKSDILPEIDVVLEDNDDDDKNNNNNKSGESSSQRKRLMGAPVTEREYAYAICVGVLLSFNAGYVNGSCLTGLIGQTGRKVNVTSHTGIITLAALALPAGQINEFGFLTSMTLCFFLGGLIAAWLTPYPKPFRVEPTYGPTFLMGAGFLIASSVIAALDKDEKYIFYCASAANGIQNGVSSLYSQNLIRSTGFTGTTTDIGIFMGQFIRGNRQNTWKLVVNCCLCFAFWLGGIVSLYSTTAFLHYSLLVNAGLFIVIGGGVVAFISLELDISLGAAIFGMWQWRRVLAQFETALHESAEFNKDESMSSAEHIDALFDQFDMDRSGTIDRKELQEALKRAGVIVSKRQTAQLMKRADKDRDGMISRQEWRNMMSVFQGPKNRDDNGTARTLRSSTTRTMGTSSRRDA